MRSCRSFRRDGRTCHPAPADTPLALVPVLPALRAETPPADTPGPACRLGRAPGFSMIGVAEMVYLRSSYPNPETG